MLWLAAAVVIISTEYNVLSFENSTICSTFFLLLAYSLTTIGNIACLVPIQGARLRPTYTYSVLLLPHLSSPSYIQCRSTLKMRLCVRKCFLSGLFSRILSTIFSCMSLKRMVRECTMPNGQISHNRQTGAKSILNHNIFLFSSLNAWTLYVQCLSPNTFTCFVFSFFLVFF